MKGIYKIIVIFIIMVISCEKDRPDIINGYRIKSIMHNVHNKTQGYYEFSYLGQRFIQLIWYDQETGKADPHHSWSISYLDNKIVKEFYGVDEYGLHYSEMKAEYVVDMDKVVQISTQIKELDTWSIIYMDNYTYDHNRLIRFERCFGSNPNVNKPSWEEFIYYSGDSLVTCDSYYYSADTFHHKRFLIYKEGLLNELVFTQVEPDSVEMITKYIYDSNNKLTEATIFNDSNTQTTLYEYNEKGLLSKQISGAIEFVYVYENGQGNADITWHLPIEFIYISPDLINIIGR